MHIATSHLKVDANILFSLQLFSFKNQQDIVPLLYDSEMGKLKVKHPNVAGIFYPHDPESLNEQLKSYIRPPKIDDTTTGTLKALIVPHAGYIYSGSIAGSAYYKLSQIAEKTNIIAILSPSHYFRLPKVAVLNYDTYQIPLGELNIHKGIIQHLLKNKLVEEMPEVFKQEHALEVHLPFIKYIVPDAQIIPLIVGHTQTKHVQAIIEELITRDIFIIVSSDLSHFHRYDIAKEIDSRTKNIIESLDYEHLKGEMACGFYPLSGLLKWAKENGGKIVTLDMGNSGDTAGDKSRVVGYGSFALYV